MIGGIIIFGALLAFAYSRNNTQSVGIGESSEIVYTESVDGFMLERQTARAIKALKADAIRAGFNFKVVSGLRSTEKQRQLYEGAVKKYGTGEASKYVAKPGSSQHETGLAADLLIEGISNDSRNAEKIRATASFKWLEANANKYGLRWYNRILEPWHLERMV